MTIKIGNQYVHTVLGYVDDDGITVITEDTELATMTGKYVDTSAEESADPASYVWTEISNEEEEDEDSDTEEDEENADGTSPLLYRLANTQMTESVQGNLVTGTNQGADGWAADTGTIAAAECQPDDSGTTANGVDWAAPAGGQLSRSESVPGEAVPETVTVSFWWMASAQCGLMVFIGDNAAAAQYNHDNGDVDADGNTLEMTGAWLFYKAMIPISVTADTYAVKITTDSAATIDICNFKVERGDKATAWTASVDEAVAAALDAQTKADDVKARADNGEFDATVLRIDSSRGTVFKNAAVSTMLSAVIYHGAERITDKAGLVATYGSGAYLEWSWQRMGDDVFGVISASDTRLSNDGFCFTLTPADVDTKVTLMCSLITA